MKKNKIKFLLTYTILLLSINLYGKSSSDSIYFYGTIESDAAIIKLQFVQFSNYITGLGQEGIWVDVPVNQKGHFRVSLPVASKNERLLIQDTETGIVFYPNQLVEPNDSIKIQAKIEGDSLQLNFSGKGAYKYECINDLYKIPHEINYTGESSIPLSVSDQTFENRYSVLQRYRNNLSSRVYEIILADLTGDTKNKIIRNNLLLEPMAPADSVKNRLKKIEAQEKYHENEISDENLSYSPNYIEYIFNKSLKELLTKYNGVHFSFKDLYLKIKQENHNRIREKVLTYSLLNNIIITQLFAGCDADDYSFCLNDAVTVVKDIHLNEMLKTELATRNKGALAYNFNLPLDSSDKRLTLSQLKGKVVLLDIWGAQCTACYQFSKAFHEKVYPAFKDNPQFVVLSIMCDGSSKKAYMKRLRREGNTTYTYPEYINLFAGKDEQEGRNLEKHYNIRAAPFILLIDKHGKIYSSTIPFFTDGDSSNVNKLKQLILDALKES